MERFPIIQQKEKNDCGISCLKMLNIYYGRVEIDVSKIKTSNKRGVSLAELISISNTFDFEATAFKCSYETLSRKIRTPCIIHWYRKHFVVLYKVIYSSLIIGDPGLGIVYYKKNEFLEGWLSNNSKLGIVVSLNNKRAKL